MNVVVDASVVLKWFVLEHDTEAALLVRANHDVVAPDLLLVECRNALLSKLRRQELQRLEAEEKERALQEIGSSVVILPSAAFLRQAFTIAIDLAEPIYDCVYLATALATDRTLVTADARFAAKVVDSYSGKNKIALLSSLRT
jgi:predicted nucleic acid-binding protein